MGEAGKGKLRRLRNPQKNQEGMSKKEPKASLQSNMALVE